MRDYREIFPSADQADAVECCWVARGIGVQRVAPDGCADLVFRFGNRAHELIAVGAMTRYADFEQTSPNSTVGIRFRPGMWARAWGVRAEEMTDRVLALEDLWGARARRLRERVSNARSDGERVELLSGAVSSVGARSPLQRAISCLETRRGLMSLDRVAREAGLSARQFRRVCVRESGLSPKLLARILRFRHAASRADAETGGHAGLAAECGFADQAHMIAEFKRFAGRTPGAWPPGA